MPDEPTYPGKEPGFYEGQFESPTLGRPGGIVPEILPLPDIADLVNLPDADLHALLQRYGVVQPWAELIAEAQRYNERWSKVPAGRWRDEQTRALTEPGAEAYDILGRKFSRGLLGMARRLQERYTTMEALDGNAAQELIRISEGDDRMCSGCAALAGEIGTYAYHASLGLCGEQQCGGNCRCQLVAID